MFSSGEVLSMVGSVGVLITAIGAVIVNIIVAVRTGKKVDDNQKTLADVGHQVQEVHTLTNSNLSAVKAQLEKATAQIEEMKAFIRDLKNERDKLSNVVINPAAPIIPMETFKAIEKNTENIDKNTKRTGEDVKILKDKK